MNCSLKIKYLAKKLSLRLQKEVQSDIVFDSSLSKKDLKNIKLFQHFKGIEIKTSKPVFKKDEVILMDIRDKKDMFNFYIYSFFKNRALVESTYFSPEILDNETYLQDIKEYIFEKFKITNFECKYEEFGIIPMGKIIHNDLKMYLKLV